MVQIQNFIGLSMKHILFLLSTISFILPFCQEYTNFSSCESDPDCYWDDCGVCDDMEADICPIDDFIDTSEWEGAGGQFPDPYLEVYCDEQTIHVLSNGIPNFEYTQMTPNPLQEQDWHWEIPRYPLGANQNSTIPLLGTVAIAINGLPIFGPNEAAFPDPFGDPVFNDILDFCLGHTAQEGNYHFHAMLMECLMLNADSNDPSPVLGYSMDSYPIYGPTCCSDASCLEFIEYQSSWIQIGNPETYVWDAFEYQYQLGEEYLDECNGHYGSLGDYHYHATSTFPYVLGCYHGTPNVSGPPTGNTSILGDMNHDEWVNILDVILVVNTILADSFDPDADMNQDCVLDILDIVLVISVILGEI